MNQDKLIRVVKSLFLLILLWFALYLFEFLVWNDETEVETSKIPSLDISKLQSIVNEIDLRQDATTNGKPDIRKFNFGNEEPF